MSWNDIPPDLRKIINTVCTTKEIEALRLIAAGYGQRRAARILGISRDTLRHRLDNAKHKIAQAKENAA